MKTDAAIVVAEVLMFNLSKAIKTAAGAKRV
jgi:hypothetical protein